MATRAGREGGAGRRNWRSPRPHATASAAPPAKNATSEPSRAAKCSSSCRGTALPASAFTACNAAAPSLEPPPSPARTGIRLVRVIATPNRLPVASSTARAARTARFSSAGGTLACAPDRLGVKEHPVLKHAIIPGGGGPRHSEADDSLQEQGGFGRHLDPERANAHGKRGGVGEPQRQRPEDDTAEPCRAF